MPEVQAQTLRESCDKFHSFGRKIAVLSFGVENEEKLHFNELLELIHRLAAGLIESGLQKQETVMLLASNSLDFIIAVLSVIYAGAIAVPVDMQSSDEILTHIIEDSEAKRCFADTNGLERLNRLAKNKHMEIIRLDKEDEANHWRKFLSKKSSNNELELKGDDQAVLFYTSGTTGLPKGVPLTHTNLIFQIEAEQKTKLLQLNDKVLLPLPLFHVYPFVDGFLGPLCLGLTVILPKAVTGPEIIRAIKEGKATVLLAVPRLLRALYTAIEAKARSNNMDSTAFDTAYQLSSFFNVFGINIGKRIFGKIHKRFPTLRLLACGGALLEPDLAKKLIALGWQVAVGYGLTETAPLLTFRLPGNRDLKSVGKPVAGVQIRIQKVTEAVKNDTEQPEIQAKGKSVFSGYRNLPEKTKETFTQDGWFKTGDTGYMSFGNLHVSGRISTTLKSESGKKIQPEDLEKLYEKEAAIREIGILQSKNELVALVVPNLTVVGHNDARAKIEEVINKLSASLPSYDRLSNFAISKDPLPRTNLGKIRRHELPSAYEKAQAVEKSNKAGKGTQKEEMSGEDKALLEKPIAKASWEWLQEKFPDAEITMTKSPQLDLNVDSLEWLNLTLEIQERFGVELNEEAIARIDTVRDLINEIVEASRSGVHNISPFEKPERLLDDDQKGVA